jgi:hypothetical protein
MPSKASWGRAPWASSTTAMTPRSAIKTILTRNLDETIAKHYEMRFRREVRAVAR